MSDNVNKVILVGNLGRDAELRYTAKNNPVLSFSLATNRKFKTAEGEAKRETDWHRATLWGRRAEKAVKYLTKGKRVYVEGELRVERYEGKDGVDRIGTEIVVETLKFLGGASNGAGRAELMEEPAPTLSQ